MIVSPAAAPKVLERWKAVKRGSETDGPKRVPHEALRAAFLRHVSRPEMSVELPRNSRHIRSANRLKTSHKKRRISVSQNLWVVVQPRLTYAQGISRQLGYQRRRKSAHLREVDLSTIIGRYARFAM
jgi:hypothetical protein